MDNAMPVESGPKAAVGGTVRPLALARWLLFVAFLVVLMVMVGGITRLTESGLSITEWKPVTGTLPPLTEAQWQAEFDGYRKIGEYQQINGPAGGGIFGAVDGGQIEGHVSAPGWGSGPV